MKELKPEQIHHNLIVDVLVNFDFYKVWETMQKLNWKWIGCGDEGEKPPFEYEVRAVAYRLIVDAVRASHKSGKEYCVGSGGFKVTADVCDDFLMLEFVVAEWDSCN